MSSASMSTKPNPAPNSREVTSKTMAAPGVMGFPLTGILPLMWDVPPVYCQVQRKPWQPIANSKV
jgi:hypothetical protein